MFCPVCAAENVDGAQFCRACGANISLVPQAVSGALAERDAGDETESAHKRRPRRHGEPVSLERAMRGIFMGLAFICVAFSVRAWAPAGHIWWFWLFLPAAGLLSDGVSTFLRLRERRARFTPPHAGPPGAPLFQPRARAGSLPEAGTSELVPPPSVTEEATRHLVTPPKRGHEGA